MLRVAGRVLSAKLLPGGESCLLYIGPPPDLMSARVQLDKETPRIGQRVVLEGEIASKTKVGSTGTVVSHLDPVKVKVQPEPYPRRAGAPAWEKRVLSQMVRPLYRYQIDGAAWLAQRLAAGLGSLLCDDPGLGKTTQTIAAICATRAYPALIVCPASLKLQWQREFDHTVDRPIVNVITGRTGDIPGAHVHVVNYDLLRAREKLLRLPSFRWRAIVLDEVQYAKEPSAKSSHRSAVVERIVRDWPTIGLTGTPIMNRAHDLWHPLHLVDHEAWPDYEGFVDHYCTSPDRVNDPSPVGRTVKTKAGTVVRLDELQMRAGPYMLRRLKHQVLVDLPPKSWRQMLVQLDSAAMQQYRAIERDTIAWLRGLGYGARAERAERAKAIVRLGLLRRIVAVSKLRKAIPDYLRRWFDRETWEPLVIFGYHRQVVRGIRNICLSMGLRVAAIGGGESASARQREVDRFQSGEAHVFVGSLIAAGVGLNLQRASEALFVERVFSPSQMAQAEDRVHRIGSKRPVTITYLDAAGTVDEHVAAVLESKRNLIKAVLSDTDAASESADTAHAVAEMLAR